MAGAPDIPGMTAGFPRTARVRTRREYDVVFTHGRRAATALLALHHHDDGQPPRLGLAVSRKVDTRAVVRNRIKRVLRDHFRRRRDQLASGAFVVVARGPAAKASGPELIAAFELALRRIALPPSKPGGTMPRASASTSSSPSSHPASAPSGASSTPAP